MRVTCLAVLLPTLVHAGPLRAVEHGASSVHLFQDVALGPTVGASALVESRGVGARVSLGLGLALFHPTEGARAGALRLGATLEGELQLVPAGVEGLLLVSVNGLAWRWFSVGAVAGVGLRGDSQLDAWTLRVGPELTATLHRAWGNFDGVVQVFLRASFPLLRTDVFSSQGLLGVRVLIDVV